MLLLYAYSPLLHMLRWIHIYESWLILRRSFSTCAHLREPRCSPYLKGEINRGSNITILQPYLGQVVIGQNATHIFVFDNEPGMVSIPELNLGNWVCGSKLSILGWGISSSRASKREFGRS